LVQCRVLARALSGVGIMVHKHPPAH
jgi:hypothetical protein